MSKLIIGSKFNYNFVDWTILDRYQDYALLKGNQDGIPVFYTCENIQTDGGNEFCRPYLTRITPESDVYSLQKITAIYDLQCKSLDQRRVARQTAFEAEQAKDKARAVRLVKVSAANLMKKAAEAALKELIFDGKTVKSMAKSAKVWDLMHEIQVCDLIITTLI